MTLQIPLKRNTGSSIQDHDFDHLCRGRIQMSGHSDLGFFSNFGASSILTLVKLVKMSLKTLSIDQEQRMVRSSPDCILPFCHF